MELFNLQGLKFEIIPSSFEEDLNPSDFPNLGEYAVATAFQKVKEVYENLLNDAVPPDIVIGADTVVSLNGKPYGKPKDKEEAFKHLEAWVQYLYVSKFKCNANLIDRKSSSKLQTIFACKINKTTGFVHDTWRM